MYGSSGFFILINYTGKPFFLLCEAWAYAVMGLNGTLMLNFNKKKFTFIHFWDILGLEQSTGDGCDS